MFAGNPKNIALLCNTFAASGKSAPVSEKIAALLSAQNIRYSCFTNNWPNQFDQFTDIFIVGGDGTLNYFINKYPNIKLPLAFFKGGTGNDFHGLLYGPQTLEQQLQTALNNVPKPADIGKCNHRYFINEAGIGFEGEVVHTLTGQKKRPGKASFMLTILKKIFSYRSRYYTITAGEIVITGKKLLVDVCNGQRAGGGFFIAPEAKINDGLFDIVIANALTPFQRLRFLPVMEKGKHLPLKFIRHFRTKKIIIESDTIIQYHLDGEYFEAEKLELELLPAQLQIRY
jgi:diacylglycerol kinase (ATP)